MLPLIYHIPPRLDAVLLYHLMVPTIRTSGNALLAALYLRLFLTY